MAANKDAPPSHPPAQPGDPIDLQQSVAGEEDPGASIDLATPRGTEWNAQSPAPAVARTQAADPPPGPGAPMAPGDEAPPGAPGTGEDVCPRCGGTGRLGSSACPDCAGTGKVNVGIGGG
jgi:hypothetical protein